MQAPAEAQPAPDAGGVLNKITLPACRTPSLLTSAQMQLLAAQPGPASARAQHGPAPSTSTADPAARALQLPPLLPPGSPALAKWVSQAEDVLCSLGMSTAGGGGTGGDVAAGTSTPAATAPAAAPDAAVALARVQQASSVACGHHRTASALPDADVFVLLMLALHGGLAAQLPPALAAAAAAPVGRFVWPAYAAAVHGPTPLLELASAARILLAREDPALFAALERAHLATDLLLYWLQQLLLPVLTVPAAAAVVALTLVHGPLTLAAAAVSLLCVLRPAVLQTASAGDPEELREWLFAVHCFDVDAPALLAEVLAIESRHRHDLLPLLLDSACRR